MKSLLAGPLWNAIGKVLEARRLESLAQSCYRRAVEVAPRSASGRVRLGRILLLQEKYAEALPVIEEAAAVRPKDADVWNMLGVARREDGNMAGAREAFETALSLAPDFALALNNHGNWLLADDRPAEALACFDKALRTEPTLYQALNNKVVALLDLGRSTQAEEVALEALKHYPDSAPLHLNLGNSYLQLGKGYRATQSYKKAIALQPGFQEAHFNLSLLGLGDGLGETMAFLRKQVERRGRSVDLLNRLAIACMATFEHEEAEDLFREIIETNPDFAPAHVGLGNVVSIRGDARQALACYERAFSLRRDQYSQSNFLFELNYLHEFTPDAIFERHLEWGRTHELPLQTQKRPHRRSSQPEKKLKVGYVSADFHHHPVGYLISGIIPLHDRERFEVHCYSHDARVDSITEALQRSADFWHDTMGMSDTEVVDKIYENGIDILVDLSGHTANHRLRVFAYKPAPIQVTWIGYFHSTGMESIDYFISDPYTSPPGCGQRFSETSVHLPHTRFCYTPPQYAPEVGPAPHLKNGYVTFGCFNKLAKITDEVVSAWARILQRVPDARLWLKSPGLKDEAVRDALAERFALHGVVRSRLELRPGSGHADMFAEYGEVDIALDPFPFTGGMTSFEALLMGVPVVTFAGTSVVSRQTASMLANLGLDELVHETVQDYIEGCIALAGKQAELVSLRTQLRSRLQNSPLCDMTQFTGDLERLYRRMWYAWCNGERLPSALLPESKDE